MKGDRFCNGMDADGSFNQAAALFIMISGNKKG